MIDREKVKKGLDFCLTGEPSKCKDCPYDAECKEARGIGPSPLRRDALELLKEQEPVHVQKREFAHMWFWCCGSCGVAITEGDKFCRNCGKKVKWE